MHAANFLRIVLIAAALAAYSAWAGMAERPRTFDRESVPDPEGIPVIGRAEAEHLWKQPATLFLDVRPLTDFAVGHVEGAVHLPEAEIAQRLPELRPRLERAATLVVYCKSMDCGASVYTAIELRRAGLRQVVIYKGGWNEWVLTGLPAFQAER